MGTPSIPLAPSPTPAGYSADAGNHLTYNKGHRVRDQGLVHRVTDYIVEWDTVVLRGICHSP